MNGEEDNNNANPVASSGGEGAIRKHRLNRDKKSKVIQLEEEKLEKDLTKSTQKYMRMKRIESEDYEASKKSDNTPVNLKAETESVQVQQSGLSLTQLKLENQRLKDANQSSAARSVELRNKMEVLDFKLSKVKEELMESNADNTTYTNRILALENTLQSAENKGNRQEKRISDLIDKLNTIEKLIVQHELAGVFVANPDYEPPETQGSGELITLKAKEFIEGFRADKEEKFCLTLDRIIEELVEAKEKLSKTEENLENATNSLTKIEEIKKKIELEMDEDLRENQEMYQQTLKDLKVARSKSTGLQADNEELSADIKRMEIKINGKNKMIETLQSNVNNLRLENNDLKKKLKGKK